MSAPDSGSWHVVNFLLALYGAIVASIGLALRWVQLQRTRARLRVKARRFSSQGGSDAVMEVVIANVGNHDLIVRGLEAQDSSGAWQSIYPEPSWSFRSDRHTRKTFFVPMESAAEGGNSVDARRVAVTDEQGRRWKGRVTTDSRWSAQNWTVQRHRQFSSIKGDRQVEMLILRSGLLWMVREIRRCLSEKGFWEPEVGEQVFLCGASARKHYLVSLRSSQDWLKNNEVLISRGIERST